MKSNAKATIALTVAVTGMLTAFSLSAFPFFTSIAAAQGQPQPSPLLPPQPVPPLSDKQRESVQQLIQQEISTSQQLDDRIEATFNDTFGWTITLINFLVIVLIVFPIVMAIGAWALRRSIIAELVNETKRRFREEIEQQLTAEWQTQMTALKQELENQKATLTVQLQTSFVAAQQEKEQIVGELTKVMPAAIQEEQVSPENHKRIQTLLHQLECLKSVNPQLYFTVDDYIRQGEALYIEQRYDEALFAYEQAMLIQPDRLTTWMGKARTLRQLGRYEEASLVGDRAIQLAPAQYSTWYSKAQTLLKLQRYPAALKTFNKAIKLNPEKVEAWNLRGYVLTKLQRYSEAKACFEKATLLHPNSGNTAYRLAYYFAAQDQIEPALDQLQQAIELCPMWREVLQTDPDFDALRDHDRFKVLVKEQQQT